MTDTTIQGIEMTIAAAQNVEETGTLVLRDVARLLSREITEDDLLAECLDGAGDDRVQGWHDYVLACAVAVNRADAIRVTVETMPDDLRKSHRAARNWGRYPVNGAERANMSLADALDVVTSDPDGYARIVETANG